MQYEICNRCGQENERPKMYHIQCGFSVVWCCRDKTGCKKRADAVKKMETDTKPRSKSQAKREAVQKEVVQPKTEKPKTNYLAKPETIKEAQIVGRVITTHEKLPVIKLESSAPNMKNGDIVKLTVIGRVETVSDKGHNLFGIVRIVDLVELSAAFEKMTPCRENNQTVIPMKK